MQTFIKYTAHSFKTLCVLITLIFLLGLLQFLVVEIYQEFYGRKRQRSASVEVELTEKQKQQKAIDTAGKRFGPDGTLYLVKTEMIAGTRKSIFTVKDRDGNLLFKGHQKDCPYSFIQWEPQKSTRSYGYREAYRHSDLEELGLINGDFSRHYVVPIVNDHNKRIGHWFYDINKQIFKYYTIAGQLEGFLGSNGYVENKSGAVGFGVSHGIVNWLRPDSYDPMMIYRTESAVYQIDFQNRGVKTLIQTDDDKIRLMRLANWQETEKYDYRPALTITTYSGKYHLFLKNPDQYIEMQLPEGLPRYYMQLTANENMVFARSQEIVGYPKSSDHDVLSAWYKENLYKEKEQRVHLFEVSNDGTLTEKSSFTWTQPIYHQPNIETSNTWKTIHSIAYSISSPVPGWLTLKWIRTLAYRTWPVWSRETMRFIRAYSAIPLISINLCLMTVFSALTLWHGWPRRTHIAKLIFWTGFVFLFNLPGFLTYLALNHTPVIHCANCGKKRGLLQDTCRRCGTALPLPKAKETDLIMPLSA
ncbi:MAG: hypothetical protein ACYSO3_05060 [Planctomycetota bacterium]|jgi:hypothetical protein